MLKKIRPVSKAFDCPFDRLDIKVYLTVRRRATPLRGKE
jgi:hypothetical protein